MRTKPKPTTAQSLALLEKYNTDLPKVEVCGITLHEELPPKALLGATKYAFAMWGKERERLIEAAQIIKAQIEKQEKEKRVIIVPE